MGTSVGEMGEPAFVLGNFMFWPLVEEGGVLKKARGGSGLRAGVPDDGLAGSGLEMGNALLGRIQA